VVAIWHIDSAGRGGGDGCCKRKEGRRAADREPKSIICGYRLVEKRYTHKETHIKAIPVGS